ncbi:MAG: glycoside hydrolase family 3 C-terminal domain-containing protein [Bacteroidaceae bacterium]|nr:glycoside hydrolase family 3 C-terminal domain-containing protein [Bacteroidaceae bacterium]
MKKTLLIISAAVMSIAAYAQPKLRADNIDEVLKAMTLEEKATLIAGGGWGSMTAGSMTASDIANVPGAAGSTQPIPRLGIPKTILADGPAGLRISPTRQGDSQTYYCTGFPVGTVLACTWNTELVEQLTTAMGQEVHEYGVDVLLAPGMNLHRNPLCGRNFEYFSEDPLLSGKISAAYVKGIQKNDVGVSVKHFAGNDQEINRNENDARINPRALRELYLKNFEITIREAKPWTIMSSYNKINGSYTQQSHDLLTGFLRDEWGFDGIVMTDWGNKAGTVNAVHAGNDLMEPGDRSESQRVIEAVNNGSLDIADLDRNVRRLLEYIVKTPNFKGYKFSNKPDLDGHAKLVRSAAAEGMVLLKNNGNLPMEAKGNIALFGLSAYKSIAGGTGSGNVNKPYIRNISEGLEGAGFTLDARLADFYAKHRDYVASQSALGMGGGGRNVMLGEAVLPEVAINQAAVQACAQRNDAAVIVIGRNAGEGDDRRMVDDFELTDIERALIHNVCNEFHKVGKKVTVVMNIGGVIETSSWKGQPDAILLAWTPGQEVGNSVADVLTGKSNPSGKLSMTFPLSYLDIPSSANFPYNGQTQQQQQGRGGFGGNANAGRKDIDYTNYAEGIWVGYRYFNTAGVEVSYPFGYGLSYTTFAYSKPVVKAKNGGFEASITVKNTGKVAGKEAVEIYVSAPDGGLVKPESELKAFGKTRMLQPGESQTLTFTVDAYTLASFNDQTSEWQTAAGNYTVKFGASATDIRATAQFKGKAAKWAVKPLLLPQQTVAELSVK